MKILYSQADMIEATEILPAPKTAKRKSEDEDKSTNKSKEFILAVMAADKPYINLAEDIYTLLGDDENRRIYTIISEARRRPGYSPGQLYSFVTEEDEAAINKLVNYDFKPGDDAQKYQDCINNLKIPLLEEEIEGVKQQYSVSKDDKSLIALNQLIRQLNEYKKKK